MARSVRLLSATRGAVMVEQVVAFLPVIWFGMLVWQLIELAAGDLVVRRAASAAARAAVVVMPDDPAFYGGTKPHLYKEAREIDIKLAAALVLATNTHFRSEPKVEVSGGPGGAIDVDHNASMLDKGRVIGGILIRNPAVTVGGLNGVNAAGERGSGAHEPLQVKVSAKFECFAAWVNLVCGGSSRWLSATATYPYQGAGYEY